MKLAEIKIELVSICKTILHQKLDEINRLVNEMSDAANAETKSSVGDKHETARAMMQLEQEKLSVQWKLLDQQKLEFEKIDFNLQHDLVRSGALVKTNKGYFIMSVPLGKLNWDNTIAFAISMNSPLGMALKGKKSGDELNFNGIKYLIEELY